MAASCNARRTPRSSTAASAGSLPRAGRLCRACRLLHPKGPTSLRRDHRGDRRGRGRAQAAGIVNMGQPTAEELAAFAAEGYGLVLDMRTAGEDRTSDEAATAAEPGHGVPEPRLPRAGHPHRRPLAQFIESVGSTDGPVLLHCKSGNRSAGTWLAWRVLGEGVDFETALPEAKAKGLRNEAYAQRVSSSPPAEGRENRA